MADPHPAAPSGKPRARAYGIRFDGTLGPASAITDVAGVEGGVHDGDRERADSRHKAPGWRNAPPRTLPAARIGCCNTPGRAPIASSSVRASGVTPTTWIIG